MLAQLNGVGEAVGLAVVGAAVVGGFVGTGADVVDWWGEGLC